MNIIGSNSVQVFYSPLKRFLISVTVDNQNPNKELMSHEPIWDQYKITHVMFVKMMQ